MADNIDFSKYGLTPESNQPSKNIDFEKYGLKQDKIDQSQQTDFLTSAGEVPFKIAEDAIGGALNFAGNIPSYTQKAKTEVPSLLIPGPENVFVNHPVSALKQAGAGLTELGHNALNFPHDIAQYISNRLNLLPKNIADQVPYQKDISKDISNIFGEPQHSGESLLRGSIRNALQLTGGLSALDKFNPMKLTYKNIAKDVVNAEKEIKNKYSGPSGKYESLSNKAKSRGITLEHIDPDKIDIDTIKQYTSPKHTESLDTFLKDKNLTTAQKAISDLGYIERRLENKMTLLEPEKDQLKAVKNAKNYIQENMFKDKEGNVHHDLLNEHKAIQKGYATEVIPYTKNKAIQSYKKGEKKEKELVASLSKGKFAAQRGSAHPNIHRREVINHLLPHVGIGGGLLFGGKTIYDYLTGSK